MRTICWRPVLVGVLLAAFANAAIAQKEQWLQYKVDRNGRGYRYLNLTTNAPAGVVLPKMSGQLYFAFWPSPMDAAGGRWLCFDRARKSGPHDRLFVDTGGAKFDEKGPLTPSRADEYSATFESVRFVFKSEDGPLTYHLNVRFMRFRTDDVRLLVSSAGYYSGKIEMGGKQREITLIDGNANATFNDVAYDMGSCDRLQLDGDRTVGKLVDVDGSYYELEVAPDGACVKVRPETNVVLGKVRVPETITKISIAGENGLFTRKPEAGEFTVPVGDYALADWSIQRKDERGTTWKVEAMGGASLPISVRSGEAAVLEIGEPLRASMSAVFATNNSVDFSLGFQGVEGSRVSIMKGEDDPPGPRLNLASLDGAYRQTNTFEFG